MTFRFFLYQPTYALLQTRKPHTIEFQKQKMGRLNHPAMKIHIPGHEKHLSGYDGFVLILEKRQRYFSAQYE